jgi:hypothetical protein
LISFYQFFFSVLVVFDGAQLDNRKLLTVLDRAQQRIDKIIDPQSGMYLSPLLLRQTFISVLDAMNIPYVSALGEGDDECVSLANHLHCYLIAQDSDYYCLIFIMVIYRLIMSILIRLRKVRFIIYARNCIITIYYLTDSTVYNFQHWL